MIPPTPIRLVLLLEDLDFGGTQRYALNLVRHLDRGVFAPEVWVLRAGGGLTGEVRASGVRVEALSGGRRVGPTAIVRLAARLLRERPPLLYTLTVLPNRWGRLIAGLLGLRVVTGYRSLAPRQHERLLHRFSARIITNADVLAERIRSGSGVEAGRVTVVPNGVDPDWFTPDDARRSAAPRVVCVARLVPEKDIPTLLEAFRLTLFEVPEACLDIIGEGRPPDAAPPNVRFLPATLDVRRALQEAWVFALASRSEASPNAVLEAMACGIPVVATRVGGVPELVEDQVGGLLVQPGDPVSLSEALVSLLRDGALRRRMGAASRARAERLDLQTMARRTEIVLREVAQMGTSWTLAADGSTPPEVHVQPSNGGSLPSEIVVERGRFRPDRSVRRVSVSTLTAFLPPPAECTGIAAVICPGGGYAGVTIDREGHEIGRWLASRGIAGLVLKYRLPEGVLKAEAPPHPIQDVRCALQEARARSGTWGFDAGRVGVMGFSAGGHMAAYAAATDPALAFAVMVYPVVSMESGITHSGSRRRLLGRRPSADAVERYSIERHVVAGSAPTLLVHAHDDDVVGIVHSERYADALARSGVSHECLFYGTGGHGFGLGAPGSDAAQWPERFLDWISRLPRSSPIP